MLDHLGDVAGDYTPVNPDHAVRSFSAQSLYFLGMTGVIGHPQRKVWDVGNGEKLNTCGG